MGSEPSRSDAFGMSYLDAWTASVPIVVMKGTPQEEIVRDKMDGFEICCCLPSCNEMAFLNLQ